MVKKVILIFKERRPPTTLLQKSSNVPPKQFFVGFLEVICSSFWKYSGTKDILHSEISLFWCTSCTRDFFLHFGNTYVAKFCTCAQDSYTCLYKKFRVNSMSFIRVHLSNNKLVRNPILQLQGIKCWLFFNNRK